MRISCRIGKVVFTAELMHPRRFKEPSVIVVRSQRLAVLVKYFDFLRRCFEAQHIVAENHAARAQRGFAVLRAVHADLAVKGYVLAGSPKFKLPAPKPAEVHVSCAVIIGKDTNIHAEASRNIIFHGFEGAHRFITHCNSYAEDAVLVMGRKVIIIFAVFVSAVRVPHALGRPRNIFNMQRLPVVNAGCALSVH
jgi:hypothetical protein